MKGWLFSLSLPDLEAKGSVIQIGFGKIWRLGWSDFVIDCKNERASTGDGDLAVAIFIRHEARDILRSFLALIVALFAAGGAMFAVIYRFLG